MRVWKEFSTLVVSALFFFSWLAVPQLPADEPLKYESIHEAAAEGDLADVKRHLKRGAALESRLTTSKRVSPDAPAITIQATPLALAGSKEVADFLIKSGATLHKGGNGRFTGLHGAALQGNAAMVEYFKSAGVNPNATYDNYGLAALHFAALGGDPATIGALAGAGAEVDVRTRAENMTPLHLAAHVDNTPNVRALIQAGATLGAPNRSGRTALGIAKSQGSMGALRELLSAGGTVVDAEGTHLLLDFGTAPLAFDTRNLSAFQVAMECGVSPNHVDKTGDTPLARLTRIVNRGGVLVHDESHAKEAIDLLLSKGADPTVGNPPALLIHPDQRYIAQVAALGRTLNFMVGNKSFLRSLSDKAPPTMLTPGSLPERMIKPLLDAGADPFYPESGENAFRGWVLNGHSNLFDLVQADKRLADQAQRLLCDLFSKPEFEDYLQSTLRWSGPARIGTLVKMGGSVDRACTDGGRTPRQSAHGRETAMNALPAPSAPKPPVASPGKPQSGAPPKLSPAFQMSYDTGVREGRRLMEEMKRKGPKRVDWLLKELDQGKKSGVYAILVKELAAGPPFVGFDVDEHWRGFCDGARATAK